MIKKQGRLETLNKKHFFTNAYSSIAEGYIKAIKVMLFADLFNTGSADSALGATSIAGILTCEFKKPTSWTSNDDFTNDGHNVEAATLVLSNECEEDWQIKRFFIFILSDFISLQCVKRILAAKKVIKESE